MRKLLAALLLLCLLPLSPVMAEQGVPAPYVCLDTLIVSVFDYGVDSFLALCPDADDSTTRGITPDILFLRYDLSASLYADASGSTWLMDQGSVFPLTTSPGWRVTSATPYRAGYGKPLSILFTREGDGVTEVCCYDRDTAQISVLHTSQESLVLAVRESLYSCDPFPTHDNVLLCTAEITQPDAASPALSYHLTAVVGDATYLADALTPSIRILNPCPLVYDESRQAALADFTAAYKALYPEARVDHGAIIERLDLLDAPEYGRLYEHLYGHSIWLWHNGQALLLAGDIMDDRIVTGLVDVLLTDLNDDGVDELVYTYDSGSGILMQHAAFYDLRAGKRTNLYSTYVDSTADEIYLRLTDGACVLYSGHGDVGTVTEHGLDQPGFDLTDLMQLTDLTQLFGN